MTSIHVGPERHITAHIGSKVACNKHKHSPPDALEHITQGSVSVRLGAARQHAARVGDEGSCGFIIGHGCATVIIGGDTIGKAGKGDGPEKALFNKIGEYGGYAALVGGAILAIPVGVAGGTLLMGLKAGAMALGKRVLFSQAISRGINLLPKGKIRDDANTVASFLPLLDHGGKAEGGKGKDGATVPREDQTPPPSRRRNLPPCPSLSAHRPPGTPRPPTPPDRRSAPAERRTRAAGRGKRRLRGTPRRRPRQPGRPDQTHRRVARRRRGPRPPG